MCLLIVFFVVLPFSAGAGNFSENFVDPEDGYLDTSKWLITKKGFLPVPIIITEPAIGYGGGMKLVFFHGKLAGSKSKTSRHVPPSISVVGGAMTENGTWFTGGGHFGVWKEDHIRYVGGIGYGSINMDYYGLAGSGISKPISFNTEAGVLYQQIEFRLGESDFLAGVGYSFIDTRNDFDVSGLIPVPGIPDIKFDSRSASVSLILDYDSRDNIFTPNDGLSARLKTSFYNDAFGSDNNFFRLRFFGKYYTRFADKWVLGLRGEALAVDGDVPFYMNPFIDMRGIKAMRYQGKQTVLGETELRWSFHPRRAAVVFGGAGKAYGKFSDRDSDVIYTRGAGLLYLIASKLGLQMGFDIARGPEDTAFYIQVGNAWQR